MSFARRKVADGAENSLRADVEQRAPIADQSLQASVPAVVEPTLREVADLEPALVHSVECTLDVGERRPLQVYEVEDRVSLTIGNAPSRGR